jgi:host factor-I protein
MRENRSRKPTPVRNPQADAERIRAKLQDTFLNHVRKNKTPLTVFLVNGVKLQGIITWFDNFSVLLKRDTFTQLIYKHAISTIMPGQPVRLAEIDEDEK